VALENTLATVFGRCLRVRQYWAGNYVLLARKGEAGVDPGPVTCERDRRHGERAQENNQCSNFLHGFPFRW